MVCVCVGGEGVSFMLYEGIYIQDKYAMSILTSE